MKASRSRTWVKHSNPTDGIGHRTANLVKEYQGSQHEYEEKLTNPSLPSDVWNKRDNDPQ